ncbi:pisatin demethylase cytochrome P450 protein [Rutstroemia sp. NJR-2017a BBW]|nr:pisatin demethylase cytochrome P450 protein [Rutstroemia sp. NJR-2017a BBW]
MASILAYIRPSMCLQAVFEIGYLEKIPELRTLLLLPNNTSTNFEPAPRRPSRKSRKKTMYKSDPTNFTHVHIFSNCSANVITGSDITGISLTTIFYYLLKRSDYYRKLREETIIKETLQIHPTFGLPLERDSVSVHCWVENRNELIFEDPDEFRPERWLTTDTEKLTLMNRHSIPFGLGTRTCIGRYVSMLEISKLVPRIVRDWDFHLQERADQMWETENITFVKPQNFMVTVAARGR